jgi:hypothetical protein
MPAIRTKMIFSNGRLSDALAAQLGELTQEVNSAPEEHVLHVDEDAWVDALVDRYRVNVPVLDRDGWWQEAKDVQIDVSYDRSRYFSPGTAPLVNGTEIEVHVPFEGDSAVFKLAPSTFSTSGPPCAQVIGNELVVSIEYPNDAPVTNIKGAVEGVLSQVDQHLQWAQNDAHPFNARLPEEARRRIQRRREELVRRNASIEQSGIPRGRPDKEKRTKIADVIVRRPRPMKRSQGAKPTITLDPILGDEIYEDILRIIRSTGEAMERSSKTYKEMGEEDRRQVFLTNLNTEYRGQVTAEAFNGEGKTDILVRHPEGRNLFIAECKFWDGPQSLTEALDQVFTYATWRDTKLALIVFVRARGLTTVIKSAKKALEEHEQFVGWKTAADETELRTTVRWPGDEERLADLNVFLVHTPAPSPRARAKKTRSHA